MVYVERLAKRSNAVDRYFLRRHQVCILNEDIMSIQFRGHRGAMKDRWNLLNKHPSTRGPSQETHISPVNLSGSSLLSKGMDQTRGYGPPGWTPNGVPDA